MFARSQCARTESDRDARKGLIGTEPTRVADTDRVAHI